MGSNERCPFCGAIPLETLASEAVCQELGIEALAIVACEECHVGFHATNNDIEVARTLWNRRATFDDVGHPRVSGLPCVCPQCVAKRARLLAG